MCADTQRLRDQVDPQLDCFWLRGLLPEARVSAGRAPSVCDLFAVGTGRGTSFLVGISQMALVVHTALWPSCGVVPFLCGLEVT